MTDRPQFEARLQERLLARAALASRPFDAAEIARAAVTAAGRSRRLGGFERPMIRPAARWLVVALLLAMALLGAIAGIGSLLRDRPSLPVVVANGLIAVAANPEGVLWEAGDIFVLSDGAPPRRIIGSDGDGVAQSCPTFSPDGSRLAFGESRASEQVADQRPLSDRAVVVVGLNDQGDASAPIIRVLLPADPGEMPCPEWSRSGEQVAFREGAELWVIDATSAQFTVFPVGDKPLDPGLEWSRDGSRIAVSEPGRIRLVRMDGGAATVIQVEGGSPGSLGWTAGDASIVYVSTDEDGNGRSGRIVAVDGTDDHLLVARFGVDVAVSPDGTQVAYVDGDAEASFGVIRDLDGSDVVELPLPPGYPFYREDHLQWSPDGQRLLFPESRGVVSIGVTPGEPAAYHLGPELNREWSYSEVTWQPVVQ